MKFSEFVRFEAIKVPLVADDKEGVIRELVGTLADAGQIDRVDEESVVEGVISREKLGSTGIGGGAAVPHTKHGCVPRLVATVGVHTDGVDFDSLDGEKARAFFLLIASPNCPKENLRVLEKITRHLMDDMFVRFLTQAQSAVEVQQLLNEADVRGT